MAAFHVDETLQPGMTSVSRLLHHTVYVLERLISFK
jgi:hypothetical protein